MVPDLDLQLQTVMKALADNVKPAVDPADKVAIEQLGLVLATLAMVRDRLPVQRRFIRRLLEDEIALAEAVGRAVDQAGALAADIAAARNALADPELDAPELEEIRSGLTSVTVSVIAQAGAAGLEQLTSVVLQGTKPSLERLRAWCIPSGFEPYATQLKALEAVI
jgi:hypothetical protein